MSSYTEDSNQVPEMQLNLELLSELPFFSNFPVKALKLLAYLAERSHFSEGDPVFEEGDDHGRAYLILSGQLALLKKTEDEEIVIHTYYDGDFLGSLSLLGTFPALYNLVAQNETQVLTISRKHFTKVLEQFPETTNITIKAILKELHQWERKNLSQAKGCCLSRTGATVL